MLVGFEFTNWAPFAGRNVISFADVRDRDLTKQDQSNLKLFPIAYIYGENGSGKTALIEALSFFQKAALGQTPLTIPAEAIENPEKLVEFAIYLKEMEKVIAYKLALKDGQVIEERLTFEPTDSYWRKKGEEAAFEGTKSTEVLLPKAAKLNYPCASETYAWFQNKLRILTDKDFVKLPGLGYGQSKEEAIAKGLDWLETLDRNGILVVDGFDTGLGAFAAFKLLQRFESIYMSFRNEEQLRQLLFTTASPMLMDAEIIHPDELFGIGKNGTKPNGKKAPIDRPDLMATTIYPLATKLRTNAIAYSQLFLAGHLGLYSVYDKNAPAEIHPIPFLEDFGSKKRRK